MGKGTDKLHITQSEWASGEGYSASTGSRSSNVPGASFRRLPFNCCAISLQPFESPVCTPSGTTFDIVHILPWLKKHGTNPINGQPLRRDELIKLTFAKNDEGEYVDPVTYKPLTNHSHIVAIKTTGNVFTWPTVNEFNIKAKNWRDLVSEGAFKRSDIITLQDPDNLAARDLSSFKYLKDGASTLTPEQEQERADPYAGISENALPHHVRIARAKEAVAKNRAKRDEEARAAANTSLSTTRQTPVTKAIPAAKVVPYNAALHTTGKAAASFTSTGVAPHTGGERALLTDEEYMLKPRRVKIKGYAQIQTSKGDLNIELNTEYAPKAVWNFVQLSKKGYYRGTTFHRNIKDFMIQGGDPTGTGRGGRSIWGGQFDDEWATSALKHESRGVISMANKGKNTNTSQFFITYRAASQLDRKHTIFGRIIDNDPNGESEATLKALEAAPVDDKDRPLHDITIEDISIFVDPFEEFQKNKNEIDQKEQERKDLDSKGGTEDDNVTWTGKRIRPGGKAENNPLQKVGKYLDVELAKKAMGEEDEIIEEVEWDAPEEPPAKKRKPGQFNFDNW